MQSTMDSFLNHGSLSSSRMRARPEPPSGSTSYLPASVDMAPLPMPFRYESPDGDAGLQLQKELTLAIFPSSPQSTDKVNNDQDNRPSSPHKPQPLSEFGTSSLWSLRETTQAEPANGSNPLATNSEEDLLFFPGGSQASTPSAVTPVQKFLPTSDKIPLSLPGRSSGISPEVSPGWESPTKRKLSTIGDSQMVDVGEGLSRNSSPDSVQNISSPGVVSPSISKHSKPDELRTKSPVLTSKHLQHAEFSGNSSRMTMSPLPIGFTSPRMQDPQVSGISTEDKNKVMVHDTEDGADDGGDFEEYDPFEDIAEIKELRNKESSPVMMMEAPIQSTVPPPVLKSHNPSLAVSLSIAARFHESPKRRPYLSQQAREFLRHMGHWSGFNDYGLSPYFTGSNAILTFSRWLFNPRRFHRYGNRDPPVSHCRLHWIKAKVQSDRL